MTPRLTLLLAVGLVVGCGSDTPDHRATAPDASPASRPPTDMDTKMDDSETVGDPSLTDAAATMRALRMQTLTTPASELGVEKSFEFPSVYGVLLEFAIGEDTATIVSLSDGNASLYTTSTFGVVGGFAHDNVRTAAIAFVKAAGEICDDAKPTTDYPYPNSNRVHFYLLTHSGVCVIDTDMDFLPVKRAPCCPASGVANSSYRRCFLA